MPLHNYSALETLPVQLSMSDDSGDHNRIAKDDPSTKEHLSTNRNLCQSIVVLVSARALGHLGFALSLFAVWLTWLLPSALAEPPPQAEIRKPKRRMRSLRQSMQTTTPLDERSPCKYHVPAPLDLAPILATRAVDTQPARHVYFADAPGGSTVLKRDTFSELTAQPFAIAQTIHLVEDSSPRPSISTLPEIDSAAQESDCSRTSQPSSLQRSSRLRKFKLGFTKARSESLDRTDQNSVTSEETSYSQRGSSTFLLLRNRTSPDTTSVEPSKNSPSLLSFRRCSSPARFDSSVTGQPSSATDILSPTFFTRKKQKRVSAPIPRTMPYGPPYFATPPMLLDKHCSTRLKNLPQFQSEVNTNPQASESDSELTRGRAIRRVSLDALPTHGIHKRSLSENLAAKNA